MPGKSSKKRNASKKKKTKPHTRVLARSKPAAAAPKIPEETKVANVPPLLDLDLSRAALEVRGLDSRCSWLPRTT